MPTLTNPAEMLAPVVAQLYERAGDAGLSNEERKKLLRSALELRGDLVNLVSKQFTLASAAYVKVMDQIDEVMRSLRDAQADIDGRIKLLNSAASLAGAVDDLLEEVVGNVIS